MIVEQLAIPDVVLLRPRVHTDARGYFCEVYRRTQFDGIGIDIEFVQENQSLSRQQGVVRGLHFQIGAYAQAKLVRVVHGAIYDVAVDIRRGSPTFGQHVATVLDSENCHQLFVPEGFAHGFAVLQPDTEVLYKTSAYYSAEHDRGILWNDPALGIEWPVTPDALILSDKDTRQPLLADLPPHFQWTAPLRAVAATA